MAHNNDPVQYAMSAIRMMFEQGFESPGHRAFGYISALRDFDIIDGASWYKLLDYIHALLNLQPK